MKPSPLALGVLLVGSSHAFAPALKRECAPLHTTGTTPAVAPFGTYVAFTRGNSLQASGSFLGQDSPQDPSDEDDELSSLTTKRSFSSDDEDDLEFASTFSISNPAKYVQEMSTEERKENLSVMRQIFKHDLQDLQRRRDYAGWVEAKKDLKQRQKSDPWFDLNNKLKEAIQLDAPQDKIEILQNLIEKVGGPPPGISPRRPYAVTSEIYDSGMSLGRAEAIADLEQRRLNHAKWQAMIAEREANEKRAEEERQNENPYLKQEEEARKRREKTMKLIYGKVEEERKKKEEKAKEIQEKYGLSSEDMAAGPGGTIGGLSPLDRAIEAAKKQLEEANAGASSTADGSKKKKKKKKSKSADGSSSSSSTDSSGRPRIQGDQDMTRGEIDESITPIRDTSDITTDNVRVQVTSGYNSAQSDPPMRKHCFTYTIRITNLSDTDAIQLTSRKFEIQTVGARQKDVVSGQGVTGRQPVLNPGDTFEYTSTAPLSVRPIGTTIVAARMKGEYEYNIVKVLGNGTPTPTSSATDEMAPTKDTPPPPEVQVLKEGLTCELGTFHFIFPEDQRVRPVRRASEEEEDEDDDDDIKSSTTSPATTAASTPTPPASTPSTPSPTASSTAPVLPGDADMTSGDFSRTSPRPSDASDTVTNNVRVTVSSDYKPERSDAPRDKHVFSYSIRITNQHPTNQKIKLIGRRFEIQTIGSPSKDVVRGQGVTGRYPVLKPGESFEYTSTAPLSVRPLGSTAVVARMAGGYRFVYVEEEDDGPPKEGVEKEALEAELGAFHFMLPALDAASL